MQIICGGPVGGTFPPLAEVARAVSLMPLGSSFHLSFPISEETVLWMPFTTSTSSTLHCLLSGTFRPFRAFVALGKIFASLVLPNLEELVLTCYQFPEFPVEWPYWQFLGLCKHSEFNSHLRELLVAEVRITERDLIEVLSQLQSLEFLQIADHQNTNGDGVDLIVTDSFLCACIALRQYMLQ
jgi:hypothetical protein